MSTGGLPQLSSLFEMVSACGLCQMPTDVDVLDSSGPCDSALGSVLQQLEALATGAATTVSVEEGFEPPSNLAAVLAIGWLVAQHSVLETLLQGIISPVTCHTGTQVEQEHPGEAAASQGSCRLAWSRARLSLSSLDSALQQHASLVHRVGPLAAATENVAALHPPLDLGALASQLLAHLQHKEVLVVGTESNLCGPLVVFTHHLLNRAVTARPTTQT